jgi:hypothetical protein
MKKKQLTKKEIEESCDLLVEQGKLVKIDPESNTSSWQEVEKFIDNVWGVTNRYETCEKCQEQIDLMQQEFMRMDIGGYWVYLHGQCTLPHLGFFTVKQSYENLKKVKHQSIYPHKMTKGEKDLVKRFFDKDFKNTDSNKGDVQK